MSIASRAVRVDHEPPAGEQPSDVSSRPEPAAGHREIDIERRKARDAARAAELDERQRRLDSREAYQDVVSNQRNREADQRDREADERDREADRREAQADQRELAALEPFMRAGADGINADEYDVPPRPSPGKDTLDSRPRHDPGEP